jgi:hypothetical protein
MDTSTDILYDSGSSVSDISTSTTQIVAPASADLNIPSATIPAPDLTATTTTTTTKSGGSNVAQIIFIIVLTILIIGAIVLIFILRSNYNTAINNEAPACPELVCPQNLTPDPTCGFSAFRITSTGQKTCNSTRYAPPA